MILQKLIFVVLRKIFLIIALNKISLKYLAEVILKKITNVTNNHDFKHSLHYNKLY